MNNEKFSHIIPPDPDLTNQEIVDALTNPVEGNIEGEEDLLEGELGFLKGVTINSSAWYQRPILITRQVVEPRVQLIHSVAHFIEAIPALEVMPPELMNLFYIGTDLLKQSDLILVSAPTDEGLIPLLKTICADTNSAWSLHFGSDRTCREGYAISEELVSLGVKNFLVHMGTASDYESIVNGTVVQETGHIVEYKSSVLNENGIYAYQQDIIDRLRYSSKSETFGNMVLGMLHGMSINSPARTLADLIRRTPTQISNLADSPYQVSKNPPISSKNKARVNKSKRNKLRKIAKQSRKKNK